MPNYPVQIGDYRCGTHEPLLVITGPCVLEDQSQALSIAHRLLGISQELPVQLIFKASFDKANRTSIDSYRGPGLTEGLRILESVHQATGLPVTTDIHEPSQAPAVAEICELSSCVAAG